VRFAQRLANPWLAVFTMPIRAFTIPIRVFTMRRSWRSRWSDPRVHDRAKSATRLSATSVDRVANGKIVEHWTDADVTGFMQTLAKQGKSPAARP
jgi:hypothetical protein